MTALLEIAANAAQIIVFLAVFGQRLSIAQLVKSIMRILSDKRQVAEVSQDNQCFWLIHVRKVGILTYIYLSTAASLYQLFCFAEE